MKLKNISLFALCYLLFFNTATAAGLVPNCSGDFCTYCDFLVLVQNVIKFLMEISISVSVIFIIYGAVMLMISSGSPEKAKKAKATITSAIFGLVIVLGSWLIINTIIAVLAGGGSEWAKNWWKINCQ